MNTLLQFYFPLVKNSRVAVEKMDGGKKLAVSCHGLVTCLAEL